MEHLTSVERRAEYVVLGTAIAALAAKNFHGVWVAILAG
jgi:hypothetical protein